MKQDVNLLSAVDYCPLRKMTAEISLYVLSAWIALLIIIYAGGWWSAHSAQNKLAELNKQKQIITQNVISTKQKIAGLAPTINTLEQQTNSQKAQLFSVYPAKKKTLSSYLVDLTTATPSGIWLTELAFGEAGDIIQLTGNTISMSLVPEFLHNLGNAQHFAGKHFNNLQIDKIEQENGEKKIRFVLSTTEDGNL